MPVVFMRLARYWKIVHLYHSYCVFVSLLAYPAAAVIISLVHCKLKSFCSVIGVTGCDVLVFFHCVIKGTHVFHDFYEV